MKLHVTGATGYLGSELVRLRPDATTERVEVRDAGAVSELLGRLRPDVVVHTAYRQDEDDVNTVGSENVARAAASVGARLVHLSTDVVFDGRKGAPYVEEDPLSPLTRVRPREGRGGDPRRARPPRRAARADVAHCTAAATPSKHELAAHDPGFTFFTNEIRSPVHVTDLAQALLELAELDDGRPAARRRRRRRLPCRVRRADPGRSGPSRPAPETRPLDCSLDSSRARALLRTRLRGVREVLG